jgi:hypothetical protein
VSFWVCLYLFLALLHLAVAALAPVQFLALAVVCFLLCHKWVCGSIVFALMVDFVVVRVVVMAAVVAAAHFVVPQMA